ncbi:di-heme oxidoredictase family protein [Pseudobacteriovorax antillogorgiicola]|uniref:CxxC motif-containing protein, DUF1111 family n=1 Tax=Pseudobacteriovorax antillogorgiicola TaxID=1513793 RepID=A0A1Y6BD24_9BACT|nr:di-heme oxidoredictase family protein [Pseudobacteriovorax antillogorgiicola]TCS57301.1 CxxC motif-containing protein (DUF1111 family) [Pseudobacteriovorax antillogorgiicola]SMF02930.1 CxxC motif-containing protein, DUF1111 family [Pseudobacteriovorax antillogorgiicola]
MRKPIASIFPKLAWSMLATLALACQQNQQEQPETPANPPDPGAIETTPGGQGESKALVYSPLYPNLPPTNQFANRIDNDIAYTYIGERVRERHAREDFFNRYRTFPRFYFENRTFTLEVVDKSRTSEPEVIFNLSMDHPSEGDLPLTGRFFFSGLNTVADYFIGINFETVSDEYQDGRHHYRYVLRSKGEKTNIEPGRLMEMEISFFLTRNKGVGSDRGDANYYSRTWLMKLGTPGMIPWETQGGFMVPNAMAQASSPLPADALTGGLTTLSEDTSAEPERALQQMAMNLSPPHGQTFVEGRRIHHTDFGSGQHSEAGNGVFEAMKGKLGPDYNQASCISCHNANGRGRGPLPGKPLHTFVIPLAASQTRLQDPHPRYGSHLNTQRVDGPSEGSLIVNGEIETTIRYPDGSEVVLSKPEFEIVAEESVSTFDTLMPPALIGLGLLEAIDEATLASLADPDDKDGDGISGRLSLVQDLDTGKQVVGRFGWKANRGSLRDQIAAAFADDMGVSSSLKQLEGQGIEVDDETIEKLKTYLATLGTPPRRQFRQKDVMAGETLFESIQCTSCHVGEIETGDRHPFAELRQQTIKPYTDLLLHDMGEDLKSQIPGPVASVKEWRTAPLWGIGLAADLGQESFLHDGRAKSLEQAILWHGGEAKGSRDQFMSLSARERAQVIAFLKSL